jgi:hypothetical protein
MNNQLSTCLRDRLDLTLREFLNTVNVSQLDKDIDQCADRLLEMFYDELQYKYGVKR